MCVGLPLFSVTFPFSHTHKHALNLHNNLISFFIVSMSLFQAYNPIVGWGENLFQLFVQRRFELKLH